MIPFIPIIIVCLAGGAYVQTSKRVPKGVLTPQRQRIFEDALNSKDVKTLKSLATSFREQGLNHHADLLEKRIKLRELPPEIKAARKTVFRKAMASDNPTAVMSVAAVFDKEGATGAANALREYAGSLVKKHVEAPIIQPTVKPEVEHHGEHLVDEAAAHAIEMEAEVSDDDSEESEPAETKDEAEHAEPEQNKTETESEQTESK